MTLSTLNIAAQSADAAIDIEEKKLGQIIAEEQNAQREFDHNQREIEQLRRTGEQISGYLAVKGRDRAAQEKKIRDAKAALNEQAEALIKTMAAFDLEAPQPALPQQTVPDALNGGDVPQTGREDVYAQQAAESGPPADMTAPHPIPADPTTTRVAPHPELLGDPNRRQDMPAEAVADVTTESPSGQHQVSRTGGQPSAETPKGRGRRG